MRPVCVSSAKNTETPLITFIPTPYPHRGWTLGSRGVPLPKRHEAKGAAQHKVSWKSKLQGETKYTIWQRRATAFSCLKPPPRIYLSQRKIHTRRGAEAKVTPGPSLLYHSTLRSSCSYTHTRSHAHCPRLPCLAQPCWQVLLGPQRGEKKLCGTWLHLRSLRPAPTSCAPRGAPAPDQAIMSNRPSGRLSRGMTWETQCQAQSRYLSLAAA